jgi:hypothetical protein
MYRAQRTSAVRADRASLQADALQGSLSTATASNTAAASRLSRADAALRIAVQATAKAREQQAEVASQEAAGRAKTLQLRQRLAYIPKALTA